MTADKSTEDTADGPAVSLTVDEAQLILAVCHDGVRTSADLDAVATLSLRTADALTDPDPDPSA